MHYPPNQLDAWRTPRTSLNIPLFKPSQLTARPCHKAKNQDQNRVNICSQTNLEAVQRSHDLQWIARIHQALINDDFELYEQPVLPIQTSLSSQQPSQPPSKHMSEILLRLKERNGAKTITPMSFIPTAERHNLMPKIDRWVVTKTLQHLSKQPQPIDKLYTINLSGSSINDEQFLRFLQRQLQRHSVTAQSLCFEITETVAIANLQKASQIMLELKQLGCTFALDDFGSGVASFTYLKTLPVDYLKIDGSLVREAATEQISATMVEAINKNRSDDGLKNHRRICRKQSHIRQSAIPWH